MISKFQIEELCDQWQTTELNVAREYVQHVLLSGLFQDERRGVKFAFKGGTALRIIWGSPRFSEDLDFTGWGKEFHVKEALEGVAKWASRVGLDLRAVESDKTKGGWFAVMEAHVHGWPVRIEWNISLREAGRAKRETALVTTPLWISYPVHVLPVDRMVFEKVDALLRRKKPRDFFDLYFVMKERLGKTEILSRKRRILEELRKMDPKAMGKELKLLTPRSHWGIARQLPQLLSRELERFA